MMTPNNQLMYLELLDETTPSKTHKIVNGRLIGMIDNLEAVTQAIYLILSTERYTCPIYSWDYGVELADLIGQPMSYIQPEIKRRVAEALLQEDRITAVDGFEFVNHKGSVHVSFVVSTIYGDINAEKDVFI